MGQNQALAFSDKIPAAVSLRVQNQSFLVHRQHGATAADLRMELLTRHFAITPDDVDLFVARTGFRIVDTRTPNREATREEIQSWSADPLGRVAISLADFWVKRIEDFRDERLARVLAQASLAISDPALRAAFIAHTTAMLAGDGPARSNGFLTLMNAMTASNVPRNQLEGALRQLESAGHEDNPYLSTLRANLALERYRTLSGPGYDAAVSELLDSTRERLKVGTHDPGDVAVINEQLSRIYLALGDEDEAVRRDWVARWAAMTPDERSQYEEGMLVSINAPDRTSVRALLPTERRLRDLDEARARRLEMEAQIDGIGAKKPRNADRDDAFNRELDEGVEMNGATRTKKRSGRGYQPKYRFTRTVVPLRSRARISQLKGGAGVVDLFNTTMRYVAAARRMRELAEYMRQRDALVSKIDRQRNRPVPPQPETVRELIRRLIDADVATRDPRCKQEIQRLLGHYRGLLEESRAAWPGR